VLLSAARANTKKGGKRKHKNNFGSRGGDCLILLFSPNGGGEGKERGHPARIREEEEEKQMCVCTVGRFKLMGKKKKSERGAPSLKTSGKKGMGPTEFTLGGGKGRIRAPILLLTFLFQRERGKKRKKEELFPTLHKRRGRKEIRLLPCLGVMRGKGGGGERGKKKLYHRKERKESSCLELLLLGKGGIKKEGKRERNPPTLH